MSHGGATKKKLTRLVVVVENLARVDDGEVGLEVGHLGLRFRPNEHVLREVVLPRELGDDAHVLSRLRARPAVAVENIPYFSHHPFFFTKKQQRKTRIQAKKHVFWCVDWKNKVTRIFWKIKET